MTKIKMCPGCGNVEYIERSIPEKEKLFCDQCGRELISVSDV